MRALLLIRDPVLRSAVVARLGDEGHGVLSVTTVDEAVARSREERFDLVITEIGGTSEGLGFLRRYRAGRGSAPVIVLGPAAGDLSGREALREGAFDCVPRSAVMDELSFRCRQAYDREQLRVEASALRVLLGAQTVRDVLVADSEAMRAALARVREAAAQGAALVLTGEAGVGKSALARAAHRLSARGPHTLIVLEGALLAEEAIAAKLFEDQGAGPRFTASLREDETVLLRDVHHLGFPLQERIAAALAGDAIPLLATAVAGVSGVPELAPGLDRYLSRSTIYLLPLRHRRDDVPALLAHFIQDAARRLHHPVSLSPDVLGALMAYDWPGNVRELEHAVHHAAALAGTRRVELRDFPHTHVPSTKADAHPAADRLRLRPRLDAAERIALQEALTAAGGGRRAAAALLGVSLRTLFYKLRRHGLE
jgi:DNA-binding NtrC family response regulator